MSLYVCGDTHGTYDIQKLTSRFFKSEHLTKKDYVLICGDCAAVWDMGKHDKYIQEWYNNKEWTTLYVDGNHENHDALDKYPTTDWNGGTVHMISNSVIHLMRGQVYNIDGHKIFTMGGAASHDKECRTDGISWWARELPSQDEFQLALGNLRANDNKVEYIFSHCASNTIQDKISEWYEHDRLTNFFKLVECIDFKHWYFGHYHIDKDIDDKHSSLYDYIIKLW